MTYDIMVDIDDVLFPWFDAVHDKCGQLGLHDWSKMASHWEMWEDYGCTKEQWESAVIQASHDGMYVSTPPFPGAVEAVNNLAFAGHRIHLVTARGFMANGEQIRHWTKLWVNDFGFAHKSLVFAKNKAKAMDALGVKFDWAIDDGIHNYVALEERGVNVWLNDAPHNKDFVTQRRVRSVWEFAKMIQEAA